MPWKKLTVLLLAIVNKVTTLYSWAIPAELHEYPNWM